MFYQRQVVLHSDDFLIFPSIFPPVDTAFILVRVV